MTMRTQPARTEGYRALAFALVAVLATAALAGAQTAASFDELPRVLSPGDVVTVVDNSGESHVGRIIDLSPSALSLETTGVLHDLRSADVSTIRQRRPDPLRNGALIGLTVGIIPGFFLSSGAVGFASDRGGSPGGAAAVAAVFSLGLGAALGAGVDALIQDSYVIYERRGGSRKRLAVSPLVSAERRGVAVSLSF